LNVIISECEKDQIWPGEMSVMNDPQHTGNTSKISTLSCHHTLLI